MKKLLFFTGLLVSANAMADSIPSNLPDGKYNMECQTVVVEKYDSPAPDSVVVDANGITRSTYTQTGTALYITSGESMTIKEVTSTQGRKFNTKEEALMQKTWKSLGDKKFEEIVTVTSTSTTEGFDKPSTEKETWKRTFEVQDNFEVNLTTQRNDEPEAAARGEALTTKNSDGSYTIFTYIREGIRHERKEIAEGVYRPARLVLQSNSICNYTPAK